MAKGDLINTTRNTISSRGNNELLIKKENPSLEEIWEEIQNLKSAMLEAKQKAAAEAAAPYLEQIKQLEEDYALILKLSAK